MKSQLLAQLLQAAPQTPGVYWMLDAGGSLLYVGKARNLRARLRWYIRLAAESSDETETLYFYPYAASTPLGFTALLRLLFALGSSMASPPTNPRRASGWELEIPSHVQRALRSFLAGRVIERKYADVIEAMYADPPGGRSVDDVPAATAAAE